MDKIRSFPAGAVYQLTAAVLFASCYALMGISQTGRMVQVAVLPLIAWSLLCYGFFFLFTKRPRSYLSLTAVGAAVFGVGCACVLPFSNLPGIVGLICAFPVLIACCAHGIFLAAHPISQRLCIRYVEISVIATAFFLVFQAGGSILPDYYYPILFLTVVLNILAAIQVRTSGGLRRAFSGPRAILVLGGGAVVLLVLLLLLITAGGPYLRSGFFAIFDLIGAGISAAAGLIWAFCQWFSSLFPEAGPLAGGEVGNTGDNYTLEEMEQRVQEAVQLPDWVVPAVIGVLLVALCIYLLWRFRKAKTIAFATTGSTKKAKVRSSGFRTTCARLLRAVKSAVSYQYHVFRHRHDACGMMIRVERWGRMHRQAKQPGETYRGYLARLEGLPPEAGPLLLQLAGALDARYYGAGDVPFSPAQAAALSALLHQHSR